MAIGTLGNLLTTNPDMGVGIPTAYPPRGNPLRPEAPARVVHLPQIEERALMAALATTGRIRSADGQEISVVRAAAPSFVPRVALPAGATAAVQADTKEVREIIATTTDGRAVRIVARGPTGITRGDIAQKVAAGATGTALSIAERQAAGNAIVAQARAATSIVKANNTIEGGRGCKC